ncbi:MAG: alpha/beta family hydrolase [Desulfomonilia bacterium]|jgi:predicted alpha/beta-hydrolase family hydrolase
MAYEEYVFIELKASRKISGIFTIPEQFVRGRKPAVILAHGAGNGMFQPLLVHMANVLAEAGYLCLRFNFLYRDEARRSPDSEGVLEATWVRVFEYLRSHPKYSPSFIVAAGKSLGGRIASQVAADHLIQPRGLVFLGYPLHPPGRTEMLRDAHLYRIHAPMLFFTGTKDPFCNLEKLREVLAKVNAVSTLEVIENADHSFRVPASSGIPEKEVLAGILGKTLSWLKKL